MKYLLVVLALLVAPFAVQGYWLGVLTIALLFGTFTVAWDLVFGLTGQVHFGPSLLVGLGGYTSGMLSNYTDTPTWIGVLVGTLVAVVGGLTLALPALRLQGPFLGLVTLAATLLAVNLVVLFSGVTGGERGMIVPGYLTLSDQGNYYIALILLVCAVSVSAIVLRSHIGLVLAAVGQSVREVELVGVSATKYKLAVFAVSAAFSGFGGAVLAHYLGSMSPTLLLAVPVAITILMGAMLGGTGTLIGPPLGAIILALLDEFARPLADYRLLVVTLLIWAAIILFPSGLVGLYKSFRKKLGRKGAMQ